MTKSRPRLGETQKRIFWFVLLTALLFLGAGIYQGNVTYYGLGLLGIGIVLGGLIRWFLERFRA
ncbi:MAG: hypothetical protein BZ151_04820 [Desulfobacca sp. 4484_104]|nr:MAG: hypothetical protein BZ151_04820 [Desulfobacca sp. 4484_104]RLA88680.1 MAG: hypothetical protein DRG58_07385 [Deltaproteobacteria bacterium]